MPNQDEAYLEFLVRYDNGQLAKTLDLESLVEQERLLRPMSEINSLLVQNNANNNELLKSILSSKKDYVVDFRVLSEPEPEVGGKLADLPVDQGIIDAASSKNIDKLYKFQEDSIRQILCGKNVVIVAPTASGKTEAFSIPIIQKISEEISHFSSLRPKIRRKGKVLAIFVYPTKALGRDQLPKIKHFAEPLGLNVGIFDGDTAKTDRDNILNVLVPEIIITNFDMIHYHLFNRTKFSRLIRTVKFLVVDEAHSYTGVFGANIHHIIKRLERITGFTDSKKLQIVAASATLPNAEEFCKSLFGREMDVIRGTGRKGKINLVLLFPSFHSQRSLMLDLLKQTSIRHHKTIAFNKSHLGSELLAFYSSKQGVHVKVHRAGLLPLERKSVEDLFRSGKLMAISATPTLELGIDIGDVDVIISDIVPINRLIQRLGRAARSGQEGYAFLALGNDPISQYYKQHPNDYLEDQELVYTDPTNSFVEEYQVLAMACDKPILIVESSSMWNSIQKLISNDLLHLSNGKFVPNYVKALAILRDFSIRGIGATVSIIHNGRLIGERQMPQAIEELHDSAIYFLSGKRYQVYRLHLYNKNQTEQKVVRQNNSASYAELNLLPSDYPYYTKAIVDEWPTILETYDQKQAYGLEVQYCSLKIQKKVIGYSNIEIGKEVMQGTKVLFESPIEFEFTTKGLVFRVPKPENILNVVDDEQYVEMSGYHASEHVIIEGSTLATGGASQDLGGISLGSSGLIFIYDGSIGGNGASKALYDKFDKAIHRALRIISECPCESNSGCPRCTYSYRCGNNNEYLHKHAAIETLNRIVEGKKTRVGNTLIMDRPLV
ncbi:MAG TPA: DEAD/DEAH box helicase [Nitrososphaeraceae archaeon]|nr:DEAD/DEAH box helicase [Nitrososphaeraceae archaeon]